MSVSQELRQAREAQNLSVHQLAEITKLRTDHIRALEEANYDIFSAPVYIKGFTRTCATVLKMDVPAVMARLEAELKETEKFSEPPPLTDQPKGVLDFFMLQLSKLDWRTSVAAIAVLVAGLVILLIALLVRHHHNSDPLKDLKPGVYHGTQSTAGQTLPLPAPKK